jgi:twitching motility two-component system response regulator PilG
MEVLNFAPELDVGGDVGGTQTSIFETLKGVSDDEDPNKGKKVDLRVLVVDDSMLVQKQMELTLNSAGIHSEFASDGQTAIDMQKRNHYDLIFLDVMMPGIDGFQTCKALKRIAPAPHVVMLTSKGSAINKAHGVLVGADAYLTKPANRETLLEAMEKVFDKK